SGRRARSNGFTDSAVASARASASRCSGARCSSDITAMRMASAGCTTWNGSPPSTTKVVRRISWRRITALNAASSMVRSGRPRSRRPRERLYAGLPGASWSISHICRCTNESGAVRGSGRGGMDSRVCRRASVACVNRRCLHVAFRKRADKPGAGDELAERPFRFVRGRIGNAKQLRRSAGRERHVECVQRNRQSAAARLHERLFSRPPIEEAAKPVARGERPPRTALRCRTEPPRDRLRVWHVTHGFDVHADLAPRGEGERSDIVAVRYVEAQRCSGVTSGKPRLAMRTIAELDHPGTNAEKRADAAAEARAGDNEPPPVARAG